VFNASVPSCSVSTAMRVRSPFRPCSKLRDLEHLSSSPHSAPAPSKNASFGRRSRTTRRVRMLAMTTCRDFAATSFATHPSARFPSQSFMAPARRSHIASMCDAHPEPDEVVGHFLQELARGEPGLRSAWMHMSPAYHEREDALERFSMWFSSPMYESLLGLTSWRVRGAVSLREEMTDTLLADGSTFHGTSSVEQALQVEIVPGRTKWAESGVVGSKIGQPLPTQTFVFSLSLQPADCTPARLARCWTIDQVAPEPTGRVPPNLA
jgi:hypothetical protein